MRLHGLVQKRRHRRDVRRDGCASRPAFVRGCGGSRLVSSLSRTCACCACAICSAAASFASAFSVSRNRACSLSIAVTSSGSSIISLRADTAEIVALSRLLISPSSFRGGGQFYLSLPAQFCMAPDSGLPPELRALRCAERGQAFALPSAQGARRRTRDGLLGRLSYPVPLGRRHDDPFPGLHQLSR